MTPIGSPDIIRSGCCKADHLDTTFGGAVAIKDIDRIALLFDFYGPLLTERQQELVQAYFLDDLSLGEIAEWAGVSRQAVHDQIKKAEASLAEFEARLKLVAEHQRRHGLLMQLAERLAAAAERLQATAPAALELHEARRLVSELLRPAPLTAEPHKELDQNGAV